MWKESCIPEVGKGSEESIKSATALFYGYFSVKLNVNKDGNWISSRYRIGFS